MKKTIKNKTRGLALFSLISFFLFFLTVPLQTVSAAESGAPTIAAKAAFACDEKTGKIFFDQNGETPLGIASMTKILSMYLVYDALKAGTITETDQVPISSDLATLSQDTELSNVPLYPETTYTVKDLMNATMVVSANAAIMALAEKISGSQSAFIDAMRTKLGQLGIQDANIITVSGLDNDSLPETLRYPNSSAEDQNTMSAKDVALIARHLIQDYPQILELSKQAKATFAEGTHESIEMTNWNVLLPGLALGKEGVDGLKTGTTDDAGACFVGTKVSGDSHMITVVMNASNQAADTNARFVETAKLMDYVTSDWKQSSINELHPTLKKHTIDVYGGKSPSVKLIASSAEDIWIEGNQAPTFHEHLERTHLNKDNKLVAPFNKNETVGTLTVETSDKLGYLEASDAHKAEVKIVTEKGVERANPFERLVQWVKQWIDELF